MSSPFQGEYELAWPAGAALDGDETQLATLASEQPGQIVARFVSGPGGRPVAKVFIYDARTTRPRSRSTTRSTPAAERRDRREDCFPYVAAFRPKRHNPRMALRCLSLLVAMLAACAASTASGAPAGHRWDVKCGDDDKPAGYGWFDSKGHNVNCPTVRFVADVYTFQSPGDHHFGGWRCDPDPIAEEISRVDCRPRRGGQHLHIRFKVGA